MTSSDAEQERELEERLMELGRKLSSPPAAIDELLALLDRIEYYLVRVEQAPPQSTSDALRPILSALVAKDLFGHDDLDVRVAVASCASEITRITAPEVPYDDDKMKDVFRMIVEAFEKLDDMSSRSFIKRVEMLETVAKVRSCLVMLDLECDDLILDMFNHFFRTISTKHPDNVFRSMETIMSLIIDESEDVPKDLVICLLQSVKRNEPRHISLELGEKVISNCAEKLKPLLMDTIKGSSPEEYSTVISWLSPESSERSNKNNAHSSRKNMGHGKREQDVNCLEENGASLGDKPSSSGNDSVVNHGATIGPSSPNQKESSRGGVQANNIGQSKSKTPPVLAKKKKLWKDTPAAQPDDLSGQVESSGDSKDSIVKETKSTNVVASVKEDMMQELGEPKRGQFSGKSIAKRRNQTSDAAVTKKKQKSSDKDKEESLSCDDGSEDFSLKEMVSPASAKVLSKRMSSLVESHGSKMKRAHEAMNLKKSKSNDESLVGARIRVWWPDDDKFYRGTVDSFDPTSKKHKIIYDDNDIEILLLRNERWEIIDEETREDKVEENELSSPGRGSDIQRNRRGTWRTFKEENLKTTTNKEASNASGLETPRRRGWPKGVPRSKYSGSATAGRSKGKGPGNDEGSLKKDGTSKSFRRSRDGLGRFTDRLADDVGSGGKSGTIAKTKSSEEIVDETVTTPGSIDTPESKGSLKKGKTTIKEGGDKSVDGDAESTKTSRMVTRGKKRRKRVLS